VTEPSDLLALLGLPSTDPRVEAVLRGYAVRNRPHVEIDPDDPDGPVVATEDWVKNSRAGIEFGFQDQAAWRGEDVVAFGRGPMVLTQIYFYGLHPNVRPYAGALPYGLRLEDDRATARARLAAFESTRHSHLRDTWDTPRCRVTTSHDAGSGSLQFVFCTLPEPPLAPLAYALAPPPSIAELVGVLDRPLSDAQVWRVLGRFGLVAKAGAIDETGQADFSDPHGIVVDFVRSDADAGGEPVVATLMLLREREFDGRGWTGPLPHAIAFDDSPQRVVEKVGRPPDRAADDATSGFAEWHEATHTLHVVHDGMSNRTMRVSLVAPGLGTRFDDASEVEA
jgi:hypothetical protein